MKKSENRYKISSKIFEGRKDVKSMEGLLNIGYGNMINAEKMISIVGPDAAPIKRMVQTAKDEGMAIDATCGRRTRAVIFMEGGYLVLSALLPETIYNRYEGKDTGKI